MSSNSNVLPHLILLLGGARAGKSSLAQRLAQKQEQLSNSAVCFIATAQPLDDDMAARIARHQAERPQHWHTVEEPYEIGQALGQTAGAGIVIVDCLTLLVSNWLLRDAEHCEQKLREVVDAFLKLAHSQEQTIICVSNEAGLGIVPETRLGRVYRDLLGRVNQQLAQAADEVYLLVAGLPLRLKPNLEP